MPAVVQEVRCSSQCIGILTICSLLANFSSSSRISFSLMDIRHRRQKEKNSMTVSDGGIVMAFLDYLQSSGKLFIILKNFLLFY